MNGPEIVNEYKFPCCQKYWVVKRQDLTLFSTYYFDISMGYSMFHFRGKTLKEAEDYLLNFIKQEAYKKLRTAEKVVTKLNDFLEDERLLTSDQLLEKYQIKSNKGVES